MDLWIRSQDRTTLIKSYEIYVSEYGKDSYVIRAKRTSHILGAYKTVERALEVLDEIQNILQPKISVQPTIEEDMKPEYIHKHFVSNQKEVDIVEFNTYVYEMPIEWGVNNV